MDKSILRAIRRDCDRTLWPCYLTSSLCTLLGFLVPTLAAWLVGDMTDALLALDAAAIRTRLLPLALAVALEAALLPLAQMGVELLLIRRGGAYQTLLMGRLLRRPLAALHGETGATAAERIMVHAPSYYLIRVSKFTLPVTALLYVGAVVWGLYIQRIPPGFGAAVALLAALPLGRTALLGKLDAYLAAQERSYRTERAREEEAMFQARSFFRVNGLTEHCISGCQSRFHRWYRQYGRRRHTLAALRVVFDYLANYGTALGVLAVGAALVLSGQMALGGLMTGYLLLPALTAFYQDMAQRAEDLQQERDSQSRLAVFYGTAAGDLQALDKPMPQQSPGAKEICFHRVTFAYPGTAHPVLKDWSGVFSVRQALRLAGENGAGKSTLAGLLCGLYVPQTGSITDEAGNPLPREALRRLVSVQFQEAAIFQGSVWENLFAQECRRSQAQALLSALGFEKALSHTVTPGGGNLSPGERRKLLLTRALLRDSAFLILDEPLNHLDAQGTAALAHILSARAGGLILISHKELPIPGLRTLSLTQNSDAAAPTGF